MGIQWPSDGPLQTLPAVVEEMVQRRPEAVSLYDHTRVEPAVYTFGQVLSHMRQAALVLQAHGVRPGETVAILAPNGAFFLSSFLGVQRAGGIPVPLYAPVTMRRLQEYWGQLLSWLRWTDVCGLIVTRDLLETGLAPQLSEVSSLRFVLTEEAFLDDPGGKLPALHRDGERLAFIQYTSGTTGRKRGVMVSHRNILDNTHAIAQSTCMTGTDLMVSWLPMAHDMGLIGAILTPLTVGFPVLLMMPLHFLLRPIVWLQAITTYRGTLTVAPNFGYQRCVSQIRSAELAGVDLSSLRAVFSGSEPVLPQTIEAFSTRFAPYGFRQETFVPAYGLAESTLAVTLKPPAEPLCYDAIDYDLLISQGQAVGSDPAGRTVVMCSVGRCVPGTTLQVVDASGIPVPERTVGEIILRGRSVTQGYYHDQESTAASYRHGWLYTGDYGYLAAGHLFITGRKQDLIIQRGRNYYPHDFEQAVSAVPHIYAGGVVAFGLSSEAEGTERIILMVETRLEAATDRDALITECHQRIRNQLGISVDEVILVPPSFVPKTTSGKISRAESRRLFLQLDRKTP